MSTSTIEARRTPAKRLGVFLVGVAVACAGAFSLSSSHAEAASFEMAFDKGAINLGAAFKGQQIMPAPKTVSGNKAAYWWDAADTGYAASAAKAFADGIAGATTAPANTYPSAFDSALYAPLTLLNACTTQYAAAPAKAPGVPSTAGPNLNFPCETNPSGGSVGASDSGWLGAALCPTVFSTGCFTEYDETDTALPAAQQAGVRTVRNWPGPINTLVGAPTWGAIQTAWGAVWPSAAAGGLFGGGTTDPNNEGSGCPNACTGGDVPLGFLDMVVPVSDSSMTKDSTVPNNERVFNVKIGANAFRFPLMIVPSPVDGSPVPITLAVTGAPFTPTTAAAVSDPSKLYVTGKWNPNTGSLSLSGALEARVLVGLGSTATPPSPAYPGDAPADQKGGPSPFVYCATPLEDLTLTTTGSSVESGGFPGTPYYDGVNGEGALAGTFNITKDSVPTVLQPWADPAKYTGDKAPNCATVNTVTKGAGAIWLGSGQDIDVPVCAEDEVGNYPDCAKAETNFAKPTLKVKKSVKGGKKLAVTVKVKNNGNVEGTANVRVQTSNGKVKSPTLAVKIAVDPGKTGSKTVKLATRKGSKGKVTVYATTNDKTGKATTKVK